MKTKNISEKKNKMEQAIKIIVELLRLVKSIIELLLFLAQ